MTCLIIEQMMFRSTLTIHVQRHACVAESTFFPTRYQTLSTKEFKISFDEKRVPICFY